MGTPNRFAQMLRDAVIPMVSRLAPFQHAFVQRLSELGIAYRGSPIVEGAGERYFDESLRGGDGIRSRFLLVFDDDGRRLDDRGGRQLAGHVRRGRRTATGDRRTTSRWSGRTATSRMRRTTSDGIGALKTVRSLLERQTRVDAESPAAAARGKRLRRVVRGA